jgi:hypothetical protein
MARIIPYKNKLGVEPKTVKKRYLIKLWFFKWAFRASLLLNIYFIYQLLIITNINSITPIWEYLKTTVYPLF